MVDKRIRIILDKSQAQRAAQELDGAISDVGRSSDKTQFALNKLAVAISAAISVATLRQVADLVQNYQAMSERVRMATSSAEEFNAVQQRLAETADGTYRSLAEAQELFIRTSASLQGMGYATSEAIDIVDSMSYAFVRNATQADRAEGAISAFSKSVSKGKVEADSWETILTAIPTVVGDIAKATGQTEQAIRSLGASGKLAIDDLTEGLRLAREENKLLADGMKVNLTDASVRVTNALTQVFVKLEETTGAIEAFTGLIVDSADAISEFSADADKMQAVMDSAVTIAEVLAIVIGSKLAASLVLAGREFILTTAASLKATVQMNAMGVVISRTTVASNLMAASMRAANASMALLGGPLGLVMIAATALIYFTSKAKDATNASNILSQSLDGLTKNQAAARILDVNDSIEDLNKSQERLEINLKLLTGRMEAMTKLGGQNSKAFKENEDQLIRTRDEYDSNAKSIEALNKRLAELRKIQEGGTAPEVKLQESEIPVEQRLKEAKVTEDDTGEREIAQAKSITATLQNELALRQRVAAIYREQALADDQSLYQQQLAAIRAKEAEELAVLEARSVEDQIRRDEQFRAALENDKIQEDEKAIIRQERDAQRLLAEQIVEEQRTAIVEQGKKAREELDKAEWQTRLSNAEAFGNALMQLGQGQSKKIFKFGQTLALAQAAVALPVAVLESFRNGGGYPWGLIPAGAMLATGLKNIQQIRSAGAGLGGGGGGSVPNISLPGGSGGGSAQIPNTASNTELPVQRRIIDLRGVKSDDKITVAALAELLEDDGAIVAIEGARQDAERRNVIGVTAR